MNDFNQFWKQNAYESPRLEKASDEVTWITVRGAHIPIEPGQSKGEAIKEHLGEKHGKDPKGSKAIRPEHVDEIHKIAKKAKEEIDEIAHQIAKEHNGFVATAPLKKAERIIEKAINDYGGDLKKVKDVARNTIVAEAHKLEKVLGDLKKHESFSYHREQSPEDFHGYSGHLLNLVASNGHKSEVQVNTPEMIYAKESEKNARQILGDKMYDKLKEHTGMEGGLGHKLYEIIRSKDTSDKERATAKKKSVAYYDKIRQKAKDLQIKQ